MKYCPNCNKPLEDDALFCGDCGAAAMTQEEAPAVEESPVYEEAPAVEIAPCEEAPAEAAPAANEAPLSAVVTSAKALLDKVPKKILMIVGAALAAIILLVVIISLFSGGTPDHALYIKDGELIYSTLKKGGDVITDEPSTYPRAMLSADGEKLFFAEDGGDLYWCPPTKPEKAQKIAGNVSSYYVNEKGDRVTYKKDGNLYQSNLKDSEKIASDVGDFIVTKDGKMALYETEDAFYLQKVGKDDRDKIGSSDTVELYYWSEDLKEVYFTDEDKLYVKKFNKDREEIARDVKNVITIYENGDAYYVTADEEGEKSLYYYNGNKSSLVYEGDFYALSCAAKKPVMLFEVSDEDGEDVVMIASKDKCDEIEIEDGDEFIFSEDGKKLYYLGEKDDDGVATLYETKVNGTKVKEGEQIDDDVNYYGVIDGKVVCRKEYDSENNTCELWVDGKMADEDVVYLDYDEDSGKFYYLTADNTLKVYKNKAKKIYDDVDDFEILPNGQVLFLYDMSGSTPEGDLYLYKGSGKAKKLDDSVSYIMPIISFEDMYR